MGKILVIAEKPSLGRSIAGAISWWKGEKFERQGKDRNTWLESDNYIVVSLVGHLYELIDFDAYFPGYDPAVKQPWDSKGSCADGDESRCCCAGGNGSCIRP